MDEAAVRHTLNRHGPRGTADQSITEADFHRVPEITSKPDLVKPGVKPGTIEYHKRDGQNTIVVEERRAYRKRLALVSMYKTK